MLDFEILFAPLRGQDQQSGNVLLREYSRRDHILYHDV